MSGARFPLVRGLAVAHDLTMVAVCWLLAHLLRFDFDLPPRTVDLLLWTTPLAVVVFGVTFRFSGMYAGIWRYASIGDLLRIARGVGAAMLLLLGVVFLATRAEDMPRSVLLVHPALLVLSLTLPRLLRRTLVARRPARPGRTGKDRALLVIGAGDAGELLLRQSMRGDATFHVAGLLDDDPGKRGLQIHGVPVLGRVDQVSDVVSRLENAGTKPDEIAIAIPSATAEAMRRIVLLCERTGVPCRVVPHLDDIVTGRVPIDDLRALGIEDLLGRAPVSLCEADMRGLLCGRRVLVTGAGGSVGAELCRQVCRFVPAALALYEQSEHNLYEIDRDLVRVFPEVPRRTILGDVRDEERVRWALEEARPDLVLHAAAYKHVHMVEDNAVEGLLTNVIGTRTVARACVALGVPRFVLVSTDKAVNPAGVMGASKRLAEMVCMGQQGAGATAFLAVRFGNVLGSTGSVVPLFREQIRRGGPVTVTHPDVARYFMTVGEACRLILQASAIGTGGEVFVLDMGEPVRIAGLAEDMIRLSGREPGRDVEIVYTGLRPGEKLSEELRLDGETVTRSRHEHVFEHRIETPVPVGLDARLDELSLLCRAQDEAGARALLRLLVPEYRPYQEQETRPAPGLEP